MTRSLLLAVVLLAPAREAAHGYQNNRALPIPVAIGTSVTFDGLPHASGKWIENAVRAALPDAGLVGLSASPLVLQLRVAGREVGRTDAGLRSLVLVEASVVLELLSPGTGNTIASSHLTRRGSGNSAQSAMSQAISLIAGDQPALRAALKGIGDRATHAFEVSCDEVLASASRLAENREYDEAIGLLFGVPSVAKRCRSQAQALARQLYVDRAKYQCGTALLSARASLATGDLNGAISSLQYVDTLAPCANEVSSLITQVGRQARERQNRAATERATYLMRQYMLQRDAIRSVSSIAMRRTVVVNNIASAVLLPP